MQGNPRQLIHARPGDSPGFGGDLIIPKGAYGFHRKATLLARALDEFLGTHRSPPALNPVR